MGVSFIKGGEEVLKLAPGVITVGPAAGQIKMIPAAADLGGGAVKVTPGGIITMVGSADLL